VDGARRARPEELGPLARTLARAFSDDPIMQWLFPDERGRLGKIERFFKIRVAQLMAQDEVWTTPELDGAAVWAQPGRWQTTIRQTLQFAPMFPMMGRRLPRALRGIGVIESHHPEEPEHWYLNILGTDPDSQGNGVGTRLLAPILEGCDRDRIPAYLESSKERNLDYYARFGFRVVEELRLPKGPPVWPMWRDPAG
jgi:GNAT superfamily N-acetyltransferase